MVLTLVLTGSGGAAVTAAAAAHQGQQSAKELTQPLYFEPNLGQEASAGVAFVSRGSNGVHLFGPDGVDLRLPVGGTVVSAVHGTVADRTQPTQPAPVATTSVRLAFVGANPGVTMTAEGELPTRVNYVLGNDSSPWLNGVPTYSTVRYNNLHPGIDLSYDQTSAGLKGTFQVAAGVNPGAIRWRYDGATNVEINGSGEIEVSLTGTTAKLVERAPVAWQAFDQEIRIVDAGYVLRADDSIGFRLGDYDPNVPLVIDPTLYYSTFYGGGQWEEGNSIVLEGDDAFVVGVTGLSLSASVLTHRISVSRWDANGNLMWQTYVGGSGAGAEEGTDIAIGGNRVFVTGFTSSPDFPISVPGAVFHGDSDMSVTALDAATGTLGASTVVGGSGVEVGLSVAIGGGRLYAVGVTRSAALANVTASPPAPFSSQPKGGVDILFSELDSGTLGSSFIAYLGGSQDDCDLAIAPSEPFGVLKGCSVATSASDQVYLAGNTDSSDFPLLHALRSTVTGGTPSNGAEAFVTRLDLSGAAPNMVFSTFLGGSGFDEAFGMAVDSSGDPVIVGATTSPDFPTHFALKAAFGPTLPGTPDGFVTKLGWDAPSGELSIRNSTFVSAGPGGDALYDVVLDADDNIYAAGETYFSAAAASADTLVVGMQGNGAVQYLQQRLGGVGTDAGLGIAVNGGCDIYLTGFTDSFNYHVMSAAIIGSGPSFGSWDPSYNGGRDTFVTRLRNGCQARIDPPVNELVLEGGEEWTETITVTTPAQPCLVDVYFLADTTGSMGSHLAAVKAATAGMLAQIGQALPTCDIAYGVADYKDFPIPQAGPYAFQSALKPSTNPNAVAAAIAAWNANGGNADLQEAQLHALHQLSTNASVGWRPQAKRIVAWFGDAPGHEPICGGFGFMANRYNTADALHNAGITVVALDVGWTTSGLNTAPTFNQTYPCSQWSIAGQAQYIAGQTGGSYQSGVTAATLTSAIVSQVTAAALLTDLCLSPSASVGPVI